MSNETEQMEQDVDEILAEEGQVEVVEHPTLGDLVEVCRGKTAVVRSIERPNRPFCPPEHPTMNYTLVTAVVKNLYDYTIHRYQTPDTEEVGVHYGVELRLEAEGFVVKGGMWSPDTLSILYDLEEPCQTAST